MEQERKLARETEAMKRYAYSRSMIRAIAEECGAAVRIHRTYRIDIPVMDAYVDGLRQAQTTGADQDMEQRRINNDGQN